MLGVGPRPAGPYCYKQINAATSRLAVARKICYGSAMQINQLSFGEYMRRLRRQQRMSLSDLTEKTGLSYSHLSRIENDSTMPSAAAVASVATALNGDLGLMLELANCLPQVILERIQRHQGTEPTPSLHRAADTARNAAEGPRDLRELVTTLASTRGLDTAEAALIAQVVDRLVQLDHTQRAALAQLVLSMRPDEQATSQ